jgi:hypothetical protein
MGFQEPFFSKLAEKTAQGAAKIGLAHALM